MLFSKGKALMLAAIWLLLAPPLFAQQGESETGPPALEAAIAQSHVALDAILNGDPSLYLALFADSEDITLGNPFGPFGEGRDAVAATLANAASKYQRGEARVERVALYADENFATLVEIEHDRAQLTGREEFSEFSVRVTSLYRRFGSEWRLVHRHADPITTMRAAQPDALTDFARRYAAAWSSQKPEAVAAFYAEDGRLVVNDGEPAVGRAAIADVARGFMQAFPDMVVAFDRLGERDGRRSFHWTLTGTNTGPGGTGARVSISGAEAWAIGPDGLITDSDGSFDAEDYARQVAGGSSGLVMTSAQQEVWQGEIDYWNRVNSRDIKGYLDLWHPDFTGWPCGASGPADLSGLADFAEGWFAGMTARGQRTVPTAEAVIVKDGFALTYLSADTQWRDEDGKTAVKREKFVHTWQETPAGWKIIGGMCAPLETYDASVTSAITPPRGGTGWNLFPADGSLTHAEDGVVLPDGRLLVGDWDHGLVTLDFDGTKRPFGDFAAAGFRTKPDPLWNSPNGISWEPDGRHVLVADITGGHIYRADTQTEAVTRIYDHPFGVNAAVRDISGAIWFTQSTQNAAGEGSEARMFAAADKPLGDGSVWRIAADEVGKADPQAVKVVEGLDFANGIVFDAQRGRLYANEIVASRILSFAVDPVSGALSDRRVLTTLPTPDNIELDTQGDLWVTSPFANAVYKVDPDTGDRQTMFAPTPEKSARIVSEIYRRLEAGEGLLSLLGPDIWGPMPGLLTGVILSSDGTVYVSGLGNALVKLDGVGSPDIDLTPILENRTRVIIEGIRSGNVSGIMALYGPGSLYAADSETLLSDPDSIRAFWVDVAASPAHDATLEVLRIERLGPDAFVEIQKYDVFDQAGARLFGGYASLLWRNVGGRWVIAADVSN